MATIKTDRGEVPVYGAGTLAYLDSFSGVIPVTVIRVITPGFGWVAAGPDHLTGLIEFRVTETRGGYRKDEVLTNRAHNVVPRSHHRYVSGVGRINPDYAWQ